MGRLLRRPVSAYWQCGQRGPRAPPLQQSGENGDPVLLRQDSINCLDNWEQFPAMTALPKRQSCIQFAVEAGASAAPPAYSQRHGHIWGCVLLSEQQSAGSDQGTPTAQLEGQRINSNLNELL